MTLSNPRALDALADLLRIAAVTWRSQRNDETSGMGSGQVLTAELAPPLWSADVGLDTLGIAEARRQRALINSVCGPGQNFYLYDPIGKFPAADPDGSILGGATVTIDTIGDDNASVKLTGLPAGYVLTPGDMFHVDYGSNPTRRALFEISEDATADGAGLTGLFSIYPHVQTGINTGAAVTLIKPAAKVFIVPGSIKSGDEAGVVVTGMGFTVMQRL